MKLKSKLVAILMAALMLVSALPMTASAHSPACVERKALCQLEEVRSALKACAAEAKAALEEALLEKAAKVAEVLNPETLAQFAQWVEELPGLCDLLEAWKDEHCKKPVFKGLPYTDVNCGDWYYWDVAFVTYVGMMRGVEPTLFAPEMEATRGMIAEILYRLEGEPAFMNANPFTDVEEGSYYEKAVTWAAGKGIILGYDETTFGPEDAVTREQLAAMLYRYAQYKGQGFEGAWAFQLDYEDADQISEYAYEAVCWCTANGVFLGDENHCFDPQGTASRAQVATVMRRFCFAYQPKAPVAADKISALPFEMIEEYKEHRVIM